MVVGSILKYFFPGTIFWVLIDLAVLGTSYLVLRRYPFVDLRTSMIFLGGLTLINILTDFEVLSGMLGNLALLALLLWVMFYRGGNGPQRRPPLRHKWHK